MDAGVGDGSTESRSVFKHPHIPSVIRPECRTYVVVDELMSCGGGHTPFIHAGEESAEAVKTDAGCSWEGHSAGGVTVSVLKMRSLLGLSAHFAFHW